MSALGVPSAIGSSGGITVLRRNPRGGFDCRYFARPCEIRDKLGGKGKK